jgi:hypothetical protein
VFVFVAVFVRARVRDSARPDTTSPAHRALQALAKSPAVNEATGLRVERLVAMLTRVWH